MRPHGTLPNRIVYLPVMAADPAANLPQEYLFLVAGKEVEFITGYPVGRAYWAEWRRGGRPIYPVPPAPSAAPKRKRR